MNSNLARRLGLETTIESKRTSSIWPKHSTSDWLTNIADCIDLLACCLRAGLPLYESIQWVQKRSVGRLSDALEDLLHSADSGESMSRSLLEFEAKQADPQLREFAMKLALADQLGTPVVSQLSSLSMALRENQLTRTREIATAKESRIMLVLVFLVLPITVLFAVFPSLQFLQFQPI